GGGARRARPSRFRPRRAGQHRDGGGDAAVAGQKAMSTNRGLESRVGQEVGVSPWVEITQERIDTFARAIGDFQWIHVDAERAKNSPFGKTIDHGFSTLHI